MDRLEKVTSHSTIVCVHFFYFFSLLINYFIFFLFNLKLMSRDEAKLVLMKETGNDDTNDTATLNKQQKYNEELEEFLLSIYEYWKSKRLSCVIIINKND